MSAEPPDVALLREMLREAERVLDAQLEAMRHLDRKAERLLTFGVAAFAGATALASVHVGEGRSTGVTVGFFLPGVTANMVALALFFDAYFGFRRHPVAHSGPDLAWLARKARDDAWTLTHHLASILAHVDELYRRNAAAVGRAARRSRSGLLFLGAAVFAYAAAYTFIRSGGA